MSQQKIKHAHGMLRTREAPVSAASGATAGVMAKRPFGKPLNRHERRMFAKAQRKLVTHD